MEDFILQAYPQNMSRFLSKKYRSVGEEDDEDMLEAGEDYQAIIKVPFKMIEVQE